MGNVLVIDGTMLYHATHAKMSHLKRSDGESTGAAYGFIRSVEHSMRRFEADRVAIAFDEQGGVERKRKALPEYKADRTGESPWHKTDRLDHADVLARYLWSRGICGISCERGEADDAIGKFWERVREELPSSYVVVLSRDHDFDQLLDSRTMRSWLSNAPVRTKGDFEREFGFPPSMYADWLALFGDPTDNVPPVEGFKGIEMEERVKELFARADAQTEKFRMNLWAGDALGLKAKPTLSPKLSQYWRNLDLVELGKGAGELFVVEGVYNPVELHAVIADLEAPSLEKSIFGEPHPLENIFKEAPNVENFRSELPI